MLWNPKNPMFLYDAPADNGGGGDATPQGDPAQTPAEIADFEAWLKEQPEPVRKAYEAHTGKLHNALKSERETRKSLEDAQKAAAKAQQDAEAETAKKNGEWQKLAEQREKELADLQAKLADYDTLRASADSYQKLMGAQWEASKKSIPAHILPLLEAMPVDKRLEYLAANADKFKTGAGGPPPSPAPADPSEADKARKEQARPQFERQIKSYF